MSRSATTCWRRQAWFALCCLWRSGEARPPRAGWLLAAGVALGPLLGYVLSRGPGLPGYSDDTGNWTEPLGVVSLVVEGLLLVLALVALIADSRVPASGGNATGAAASEDAMTSKSASGA